MSIFRRVVVVNTALLVAAALGLALSPATISQHVTTEEWIVLACGTAFAVTVNILMLRRVFEPLQRIERVMRRVDPRDPGRRAAVSQLPGQEVTQVALALNDMLDRLEAERASSGRRALEAQEAERTRVARELHDEVGQLLTGVMLQLEGVARRTPPEVREEIEEIQQTAREGVEAVREITRGLRPPALDEFGLRSALVALADGMTERTRTPVRHEIDPRLPSLDSEIELAIYRIAQEAVTNATRHAHTDEILVELHRRDGALVLQVADHGVGIAVGNGKVDGSGLAGMRERALMIGGHLEVAPATGGGTLVELQVPLP